MELRWDIVSHPFLLPDASGTALTFGYITVFPTRLRPILEASSRQALSISAPASRRGRP